MEISWRELETPKRGAESEPTKSRESVYRAYLNWTPKPGWTTSIEYYYEDYDNLTTDERSPEDVQTQIVPITLSYFSPSGFFSKLRTSYLNQTIQSAKDLMPIDEGVTWT